MELKCAPQADRAASDKSGSGKRILSEDWFKGGVGPFLLVLLMGLLGWFGFRALGKPGRVQVQYEIAAVSLYCPTEITLGSDFLAHLEAVETAGYDMSVSAPGAVHSYTWRAQSDCPVVKVRPLSIGSDSVLTIPPSAKISMAGDKLLVSALPKQLQMQAAAVSGQVDHLVFGGCEIDQAIQEGTGVGTVMATLSLVCPDPGAFVDFALSPDQSSRSREIILAENVTNSGELHLDNPKGSAIVGDKIFPIKSGSSVATISGTSFALAWKPGGGFVVRGSGVTSNFRVGPAQAVSTPLQRILGGKVEDQDAGGLFILLAIFVGGILMKHCVETLAKYLVPGKGNSTGREE